MKTVVRTLICVMASALMVAGFSAPSYASSGPDPQSAAPTQQQLEQAQKDIEDLTQEELVQLGKDQADLQKDGSGSTAARASIGWPSYTFSHGTTVRLFNAVKAGGVTAAAGICALVVPTGPVGRALAAGGCVAVGSFLASYGKIPSNKCVNVNIRLSTKLVTC